MTTESSESTPVESSALESGATNGAAANDGVDSTATATSADPDASGAIAPEAEETEITDPKLMDRYECRACGYIYEPMKGDDNSGIDAGVPFKDIYDSWKCPVCTAPKRQFSNIGPAGNPSGFKENLGYGLGVNVLTPGQKNILIFGSLLLGFLFFMSLYGLR
ncbi:MAG: rubredoxin [Leptolyngbyaceae bacterium]|nr:rubredoxin [Leptolyngbyaceae bacterium]